MDENYTKAQKLSAEINDLVNQINLKLAGLDESGLKVDFKYEISHSYPHKPEVYYRGWIEL